MSEYLYILDAGHGGTYPEGHKDAGEYVTAPSKRSPVFDGVIEGFQRGFRFNEGEWNRKSLEYILQECESRGIDAIDLNEGTWEDVPLHTRCRKANKINKDRKSIFISIHSNAAGDGRTFNNAKGNGVYIYLKSSKTTKVFAQCLATHYIDKYEGITKWRGIKERNFAVLRETHCPAVLLETGFFTNAQEVQRMMTHSWITRLAEVVCDAIEDFEKSL